MPVVNERFLSVPVRVSVFPVTIEPLRLLVVPKNTVPDITGAGIPPVGVIPALMVEEVGTVPMAIKTLPAALFVVRESPWIVVVSPILICGRLLPLAR